MRITLRAAAVALLASVTFFAGCVQAEEASILYPDGSGKVTIRASIRKSILKMIQESGGTALEEVMSVDRFAELSEGVAAWVAGKREEDAQWIRLSFVGYFEDISKVRIYDESAQPGEEGKKVLSYGWTFERRGKGGKLTLVPGAKDLTRALNRMKGPRRDPFGKAAQELETLKPLLEDFKVSVAMTVPGPVSSFGGFVDKKDRTVTFALDGRSIVDIAADQDGIEARRMRGFSAAFVAWEETAVPSGEMDAFKKELSDAKEAWARKRGLPVESKPAAAKKKSLADDADRFSDDEVNRAFVRAQIKTAKIYIKAGMNKDAREILDEILKKYGKYAESAEAKTLLDGLNK